MSVLGKILFDPDGTMKATVTPDDTRFLAGAWNLTMAGKAVVIDLAAGAVPGTAIFRDGAAFDTTGKRYVTTNAPAAGDFFLQGRAHRPDGALRVVAGPSVASDFSIGGWDLTSTGASRMEII